ncbi:MAG: hypothetical protein C0501_09015 [Isosphaera sp.]|nr:hypothetical protein [Isosphaera sp.]
MKRTHGGAAALTLALAAGVAGLRPAGAAPDDEPAAAPPPRASALAGSAVAAVLDANGGKPPATGEDLVKALGKLGTFAQLPVVFSGVRLDSGVGNPRVVIAQVVDGLGDAGPADPNLTGRLFLAANMERDPKGGDPRVRSVEFISWNTLRRRFDFGVIDGMGGDAAPELRVVDGGRCFACHKNKGPILGAAPWTNSTHHTGLRTLTINRLRLDPAVPGGRDRVDGMALAAPAAAAVDGAVRTGASLRLARETFRLMNRSDGGRKAFVALLVAVAAPGPLDPNDKPVRAVVDAWGNDPSWTRFVTDWVAVARGTNTGTLVDFAPIPKPLYAGWGTHFATIQPVPQPPPGGFPSPQAAAAFAKKVETVVASNQRVEQQHQDRLRQLALFDAARAAGVHGVPSVAQPSNPRAFVPPQPKVSQRPSGMVNPYLLAGTIGLSGGDRKFLWESLAAAAGRVKNPKVTAAVLARAVFEGEEFADVLAGGPLPDRDEFKDRFVAGLDAVLRTRHGLAGGFAPDRAEYAGGPRHDPKAAESAEAAVVPTSACLRCHDIRPAGTARPFEPIPDLAFDPFDKAGRAAWLAGVADRARRKAVLGRLLERMATDADMPPEDAPEHDLFRVKGAAAFAEARAFLEAELEKIKKP